MVFLAWILAESGAATVRSGVGRACPPVLGEFGYRRKSIAPKPCEKSIRALVLFFAPPQSCPYPWRANMHSRHFVQDSPCLVCARPAIQPDGSVPHTHLCPMTFTLKTTAAIAAGILASVCHAQQIQHAPDNAVRNSDGSRTILRSQQLPEANERHARWCQQHGGVDITNEGDVTLGPNSSDAVICRRTDMSAPGFTGAYRPKDGRKDIIDPDATYDISPSIGPNIPPASTLEELMQQQEGKPPPARESSTTPRALFPTISVFPNNGYTEKVNTLFHPASYAVFRGFSGSPMGRVSSRIPVLGCNWGWEGPVIDDPHEVNGFVGCTAGFPGVIRTTIEACVGVTCARGEGSFVVEP